MVSEKWLSDKLRAIDWTPKQFAEATGFRYRDVVKWCKSAENIPEPLRRPLHDAVGYAVEEEHGESPNSGAALALGGLKRRIGHRAPRSGRRVEPHGGFGIPA